MVKAAILCTTLLVLVFSGCGREAPLSSAEEGLSDPAAKLTTSRGVAGGWRRGMVPIAGHLEGQPATEGVSIAPTGPCPDSAPAGAGIILSGSIAPLGEVTGEMVSCGVGTLAYWNGHLVLQDAAGDQLELHYWGRFTSFDPNAIPQAIFQGTNRIVGGTGRYAGASGTLAHNGSAIFGSDGSATPQFDWDGLVLLPNMDN